MTRAIVHDLWKISNIQTHFMVSLAASELRIGRPVALGFHPQGGGLAVLALEGLY